MFGKLLTNQKIAHKIVKPYVYKALREGLKTHDNGKIQNLRGFGSLSLRGDILDGTALMYSLDGVLIVSQELKMGTAIFDVTTLASGTYIVKILSEVTVPRSIKIVVQH